MSSKTKKTAKTKAPKTATIDAPATRKREWKPDPRLPAPGTVIERTYKGRELSIKVEADGLTHDDTKYASASALARAVTGAKSINGVLWLLGKPKSPDAVPAEKPAKAPKARKAKGAKAKA